MTTPSTIYNCLQYINSNYCNLSLESEHQFVSQLQKIDVDLKIMHPFDPKVNIYTDFMKKIFSQIEINTQWLWFCCRNSSEYVRVYFSQPKQYPITNCCRKSVYVEFYWNYSGSIVCLGCQHQLYQFVYSSSESLNDDSTVFKIHQQENIMIGNQIQKMINSRKYRRKQLGKTYNIPQTKKQGGFIIELQNTKSAIHQQKQKQNNKKYILSQDLNQSKYIIEQIFER